MRWLLLLPFALLAACDDGRRDGNDDQIVRRYGSWTGNNGILYVVECPASQQGPTREQVKAGLCKDRTPGAASRYYVDCSFGNGEETRYYGSLRTEHGGVLCGEILVHEPIDSEARIRANDSHLEAHVKVGQ